MQAKPILDESLAKHGGSSTYTDRLPFNGEIRTTVVSVIVPVWNSATHLQACIDSLLRQTLARDEYEVILVDNGSLDESLAIAQSCEDVRLFVEKRPGSYAARNLGISAARGQYVAFMDSDCVADPGWLENGLRVAQAHPEAGIVAGRIELVTSAGASRLCDAYERTFSFNQAKNISNGVAVTANWFSPAEVVRKLGAFRGDLKSGGDHEFARRIRKAGYPILYAPDALVFHAARSSFSELAAKSRRVIGGRMASRSDRNGLEWVGTVSRDTMRRLWIASRARHLSWGAKGGVWALSLALWAVTLHEILRISSGAEARRA